MRFLLFLAILTSLNTNLSADVFKFGGITGITTSSNYISGNFKEEVKTNFIGLTVQRYLDEEFDLQSGLTYYKKGKGSDRNSSYLDLPLLLKYKHPITEKLTGELYGGLVSSFKIKEESSQLVRNRIFEEGLALGIDLIAVEKVVIRGETIFGLSNVRKTGREEYITLNVGFGYRF